MYVLKHDEIISVALRKGANVKLGNLKQNIKICMFFICAGNKSVLCDMKCNPNLNRYSFKNIKIKISVTIIFLFDLRASFTLREGHRLSIGCWGRYFGVRRR
jgi:hypothetical protein